MFENFKDALVTCLVVIFIILLFTIGGFIFQMGILIFVALVIAVAFIMIGLVSLIVAIA